MSGGDGRGVGQKSDGRPPLSPPSLSLADFFLTGENFELFADLPTLDKPAVAASERRESEGTVELRSTISRLAATGLTRAKIARAVGIGESTLYANFFPEIGGRRNSPGRRAHTPTDDQRRIVSARTAEGRSVETIAAELGLSAPTVRKHYRHELQRAAGA